MSYKAKQLKSGKYSAYLNGKFHQFQGYETCLEELANSMQEVLDYAERQETINAELKAENWKDEQLQAMKKDYDEMKESYYRGFPITEEQSDAISRWQDQHWTNKHNAPDIRSRLAAQGAVGGAYEYRFVPTSIGTSGVCRCKSCHKKVLRELGNEEDYKSYSAYDDKRTYLVAKYDSEFEFQEIG